MDNQQNQHHTTNPLTSIIRANEDIEKAVIGTLLSVENSMMDICEGLTHKCFYNTLYSELFEEIQKMDSLGLKIDALTVFEAMQKANKTCDMLTIVQICNHYTHDLYTYSLIVKEKAVERGVILLCQESNILLQNNNDVGDVLYHLTSGGEALMENLVGASNSEHISEVCKKSLIELEERIKKREEGKITGIPTGLVDLDRHTRGWKNKTLIVIAARPGMGKTATMLHLILSAAKAGHSVAVFSLEMGNRELIDRLIVGESNVRSEAYDAGTMTNIDIEKVENAAQSISNIPVYIDDTPNIGIQYIRSRCRILKRQGKCELVAIDYLQLMDGERMKNGNREQEIASITKGLKGLSKELDIPIILLAQLNRESEKRADKRPLLSDLRESGSIEQDADIVIFPHRPSHYGLPFEYQGNSYDNGIEFIFAKFRNGSVGTVYAQTNDSKTKFFDINTKQYEESQFSRQARNHYEPSKPKDQGLPF